MSRISETLDRLRVVWYELAKQWLSTRQDWSDQVGDRFEQEFWSEWDSRMPQLLEVVAELEHALHRALRA